MKHIIPIKLNHEWITFPYNLYEDATSGSKITIDTVTDYMSLFARLLIDNWWELQSYEFDYNLCIILEKMPANSDIWSLRSRLSIPLQIVFWKNLHEFIYDEDSNYILGGKQNYETYISTPLNNDSINRILALFNILRQDHDELNSINKSIRFILLDIARKADLVFDFRFAQYVAIIESLLIASKEYGVTKKIGKRLSFVLWTDPRKDSALADRFSDYHYDKRSRVMHGDHVLELNRPTEEAVNELKEIEEWCCQLLEMYFLTGIDKARLEREVW